MSGIASHKLMSIVCGTVIQTHPSKKLYKCSLCKPTKQCSLSPWDCCIFTVMCCCHKQAGLCSYLSFLCLSFLFQTTATFFRCPLRRLSPIKHRSEFGLKDETVEIRGVKQEERKRVVQSCLGMAAC